MVDVTFLNGCENGEDLEIMSSAVSDAASRVVSVCLCGCSRFGFGINEITGRDVKSSP
jgi:hypothetical protein